jgi:hypothetical protein
MCTFKSDQEVMVCDVAIGKVRSQLGEATANIEFTPVHGVGTLVRTANTADASHFRGVVQAAIDEVNCCP